MTWFSVPAAASPNSITMTATDCSAGEPCGVEYYFAETSHKAGGSDSGWISSNTYIDANLEPNTTYTYKVRARDLSRMKNLTDWSVVMPGTTSTSGTGGNDITPPIYTPNGSFGMWAKIPNSYAIGYYYYHNMASVVATDAETPPVQYKFALVSGTGRSSNWQESPVYTVGEFMSQSGGFYQIHIRNSRTPTPIEITSTIWEINAGGPAN
jgi:hypothetical protein